MPGISELGLLFVSSLLAATLLPAQSELVLAGLHQTGTHHPQTLIAVATLGNVLGACINWFLGRHLEQYKERRGFPISKQNLERAAQTYQRYGLWSLLFSWVPFIGDPLTVIAGLLRTPFPQFLLLVTLGKLLRYMAVLEILVWTF